MKPYVVVTGGAGYIGTHTIVDLVGHGYQVICIDNFSRSNPLVVPRLQKLVGSAVQFITADLTHSDKLDDLFNQIAPVESIIHFAAFKSVPESVIDPFLYYHNNISSLLNVIQTGSKYGLKNLVFSSSCSVYGDIDRLPVSESTPLSEPKSPYAASKVFGERILSDSSVAYNLNAISLRYFNPVGAHESGLIGELSINPPDNLFPIITSTLIGNREKLYVFGSELPTRDGTCIRDYVHVSDIAHAHTLALDRISGNSCSYDVINLGTGNGISVLEAISAFEKVSSKQLNYEFAPPRQGDVVSIFTDSSKAQALLNWSPTRDLNQMVASAWNWELQLLSSFGQQKKHL